MNIFEMRPTRDDWQPNYPDSKVKVYMRESRTKNEGGVDVPCWEVGVSNGKGTVVVSKVCFDKTSARVVYDRLVLRDVVTISSCIFEYGMFNPTAWA